MADIEFGKDGIKLSYRKYIANTATGFVFYLLIFGATTFYFPEWAVKHFGSVKTETATFLLVALFLLATAIGEFISGLSWIFLAIFVLPFYKWMFERKFKNKSFVNLLNEKNYIVFRFEEYKDFFGLTKQNWYAFYKGLTTVFECSIPLKQKIITETERIDSNGEFTRNLAFYSIVILICSVLTGCWVEAIVSFVSTLFCFLIIACEKNYVVNKTFYYSYIYLLNKIEPREIDGKFINVQTIMLKEISDLQA
jgi:hypothetical protein